VVILIKTENGKFMYYTGWQFQVKHRMADLRLKQDGILHGTEDESFTYNKGWKFQVKRRVAGFTYNTGRQFYV